MSLEKDKYTERSTQKDGRRDKHAHGQPNTQTDKLKIERLSNISFSLTAAIEPLFFFFTKWSETKDLNLSESLTLNLSFVICEYFFPLNPLSHFPFQSFVNYQR